MSFSFTQLNITATDVRPKIADAQVPQNIKDFVESGIAALQKHYGDDVVVNVTCYGHVHNGEEGNYDQTNATIKVERVVKATAEHPREQFEGSEKVTTT